jgi:hypothetical protein
MVKMTAKIEQYEKRFGILAIERCCETMRKEKCWKSRRLILVASCLLLGDCWSESPVLRDHWQRDRGGIIPW